jgi:hypothetical protein
MSSRRSRGGRRLIAEHQLKQEAEDDSGQDEIQDSGDVALPHRLGRVVDAHDRDAPVPAEHKLFCTRYHPRGGLAEP